MEQTNNLVEPRGKCISNLDLEEDHGFSVVKWNILHLPLVAVKALAVVGVGKVTAPFGGDPTKAEAQPSIVVCVDGDEGRELNVLILLPLAFCLNS